jgi:antitoxin (DNA-binding transcriptional repressor) of toxin-antitoxin stability system
MRVVTPLDLRRQLGQVLDAASAGERFLIERDRHPLAMLVSVEDGHRLDEPAAERRARALAALDRLVGLAVAAASDQEPPAAEAIRQDRARDTA